MRRLYILPKNIWQGAVQVGVSFKEGEPEPVMVPFAALLHPVVGSYCIDLPGCYLLMCTSVDDEERSEDLVRGHPEVAILPHPTIEGNSISEPKVISSSRNISMRSKPKKGLASPKATR